MKIIVKVKTNAKRTSVERVTQTTQNLLGEQQALDVYKVSVTEPPVDGKANKAVIEALSGHFGIAPSCITISSGATSKTKIITLLML